MIFEKVFSRHTFGIGASIAYNGWRRVAITVELGPLMLSVGPYSGNPCFNKHTKKVVHKYCPACFICERCGENQAFEIPSRGIPHG